MKMTKVHYVLLTAVLSLTTLGVGAVLAIAQPPGRPAKNETLQGKVTELTKNDHNDPDDWKLDNGQTVHVPPHAFADLKNQIKVGAIVSAITVKKHRPDGSIVNEAIAVDVGDRHVAILPPTPPSPPQNPNKKEIPMKAKGKIVSFHENKEGDTDGFVLSDDTEIKFPPHVGEALIKDLKVGTEVRPIQEKPRQGGKRLYVTRKDGGHFELIVRSSNNGQLMVGRPLAKEFDGFLSLFLWLLGVIAVGLALAAIMAWRLVAAVARPVESLAEMIGSIDHRELDRRLPEQQPGKSIVTAKSFG